MQKEEQIRQIEQRVQELLKNEPAHFLVEVRIKPINNVKVFVDGDKGIALSDLVNYNRRLYRMLEDSGIFPDDDFSLEVSSPGLDEPLKMFRQYSKNTGRYVSITMQDGTILEGRLVGATADGIVLEMETGKGKKKETRQETFLFDQIKTTKIQIKF